MLNLDWSGYSKDMVEFVKQIDKIAGNVLISSPNDYAGALDLLHKLR